MKYADAHDMEGLKKTLFSVHQSSLGVF